MKTYAADDEVDLKEVKKLPTTKQAQADYNAAKEQFAKNMMAQYNAAKGQMPPGQPQQPAPQPPPPPDAVARRAVGRAPSKVGVSKSTRCRPRNLSSTAKRVRLIPHC